MFKKITQKLFELSQNESKSLAVIFCFTILAYSNIFQNQFILDDFDYIVDWPLIQDWKNFPTFFLGYIPPPGQEGIYSPLKTFFHALNYHLFGLNPSGYHIVSILIHGLGILCVYKISALLTNNQRLAFVASLIFGLHPVQVEAITYMTASVDMIGIVFLFASFFYFIKSVNAKTFSNTGYSVSIMLAVAAIFTHELAISLPVFLENKSSR